MGEGLKSYLIEFLAGITVLILDKWPLDRIARRHPQYRRYRLAGFALLFLVLNIIVQRYFSASSVTFLYITIVILGWFVFRELDQFWYLGIVGADREMVKGIDYAQSLSMCTSSLEFLGIGAGKLHAEERAFSEAIDRCSRPDRPIRFLLCRPDSDGLRNIAQSARRPEDEFRKIVLDSLRSLAKFKNERAKNIRVRLYKEFPVFRLMFINDQVCLASPYFLGRGGDGSEAPQLHIIRASAFRQDMNSLYYGFHFYFEKIWELSDEWDFKSFL